MSYTKTVEINTNLRTPATEEFEQRVEIKDRLFIDGVLQLTGILRDETVVEVMKNDLGS